MAQAAGLSASLGAYQAAYERGLRQLDDAAFQRRLFEKDPSLWNGDQEAISHRLGWLTVARVMGDHADELRSFARDVRERGFEKVVLFGMGGSSLAPEVIYETLGAAAGFPSLVVLDTTDPATITGLERELDLARTLFIVSSKSGTTVETASLYRYFAAKVRAAGANGSLDNFVAITDPGTPLERLAHEEGFGRVFANFPEIGGRFSALSYFGLVPVAAIGVQVGRLLDSAESFDARSAIELGAMLGGLALAGRDKVTFVTTLSLRGFGAWAEQLLAESTGKLGKGIIPVDGEPPGTPDVYGDDRLFVNLRLNEQRGSDGESRALEAAGHPVITITLSDKHNLGAEFLRWEIATAAAGSLLGINPFDEPNVAEAKERTSEILRQHAPGEREEPAGQNGVALHGLLASSSPGDYVAILAFIQRTREHDDLLTRLRAAVRGRTKLATSLGYGPRYLHSTGQLFKGGPDNGVFVQIVADDAVDLEIPGEAYSFGELKRAQALGDFQALQSRGRRALRLDVGSGDTRAELEQFVAAVEAGTESASRTGGA